LSYDHQPADKLVFRAALVKFAPHKDFPHFVRMMPAPAISPREKFPRTSCRLHDLRNAKSAGVLPGISDEWRDREKAAVQAED